VVPVACWCSLTINQTSRNKVIAQFIASDAFGLKPKNVLIFYNTKQFLVLSKKKSFFLGKIGHPPVYKKNNLVLFFVW